MANTKYLNINFKLFVSQDEDYLNNQVEIKNPENGEDLYAEPYGRELDFQDDKGFVLSLYSDEIYGTYAKFDNFTIRYHRDGVEDILPIKITTKSPSGTSNERPFIFFTNRESSQEKNYQIMWASDGDVLGAFTINTTGDSRMHTIDPGYPGSTDVEEMNINIIVFDPTHPVFLEHQEGNLSLTTLYRPSYIKGLFIIGNNSNFRFKACVWNFAGIRTDGQNTSGDYYYDLGKYRFQIDESQFIWDVAKEGSIVKGHRFVLHNRLNGRFASGENKIVRCRFEEKSIDGEMLYKPKNIDISREYRFVNQAHISTQINKTTYTFEISQNLLDDITNSVGRYYIVEEKFFNGIDAIVFNDKEKWEINTHSFTPIVLNGNKTEYYYNGIYTFYFSYVSTERTNDGLIYRTQYFNNNKNINAIEIKQGNEPYKIVCENVPSNTKWYVIGIVDNYTILSDDEYNKELSYHNVIPKQTDYLGVIKIYNQI